MIIGVYCTVSLREVCIEDLGVSERNKFSFFALFLKWWSLFFTLSSIINTSFCLCCLRNHFEYIRSLFQSIWYRKKQLLVKEKNYQLQLVNCLWMIFFFFFLKITNSAAQCFFFLNCILVVFTPSAEVVCLKKKAFWKKKKIIWYYWKFWTFPLFRKAHMWQKLVC